MEGVSNAVAWFLGRFSKSGVRDKNIWTEVKYICAKEVIGGCCLCRSLGDCPISLRALQESVIENIDDKQVPKTPAIKPSLIPRNTASLDNVYRRHARVYVK